MHHFFVADKSTLFKFGTHMEARQFLPSDHKLGPVSA